MKNIFRKNYLIMILSFSLTILAISSLVYAGFTRQYNPEVNTFSVTISSQENMMISSSGVAGTFKDIITFTDLVDNRDVTLSPLVGKVTVNDEDYEVLTLTDSLNNPANSNKYLAFDLFFIGSSDMDMYLAGNTSGTVILFDDSDADISFTEAQRESLKNNLRIAFLSYATVYQHSETGTTINYSSSPISTKIYANQKLETANYNTFNVLGYSNTSSDTLLTTTTKNEVKKIRVVIWLEDDNSDLEAICKLSLSLRFQAVLKTS